MADAAGGSPRSCSHVTGHDGEGERDAPEFRLRRCCCVAAGGAQSEGRAFADPIGGECGTEWRRWRVTATSGCETTTCCGGGACAAQPSFASFSWRAAMSAEPTGAPWEGHGCRGLGWASPLQPWSSSACCRPRSPPPSDAHAAALASSLPGRGERASTSNAVSGWSCNFSSPEDEEDRVRCPCLSSTPPPSSAPSPPPWPSSAGLAATAAATGVVS
mmetsp:Transcript_44334/g.112890  ORF Transcript_44334/g.112890 Transcript_44334/m.112890 type:complete len:217 (-) Transcript_44334:716-1366(-)